MAPRQQCVKAAAVSTQRRPFFVLNLVRSPAHPAAAFGEPDQNDFDYFLVSQVSVNGMCKENAHTGQGNKRNQKIEHRTLLKLGTLNTPESVTAFCFRIVSSLWKMVSFEPDGDPQAVCSASVTVATHLSAACAAAQPHTQIITTANGRLMPKAPKNVSAISMNKLPLVRTLWVDITPLLRAPASFRSSP